MIEDPLTIQGNNVPGGQFMHKTNIFFLLSIVFSNTWQELVVTGALPFIVLVVSNIHIYLKIRESSKHESHRLDEFYCLKMNHSET